MPSPNYKYERLRVRLSTLERLRELRLILAYESSVRGLTMGQTVCELVAEAADTEAYPQEVRARLAEIEEASRRRAVERSLNM